MKVHVITIHHIHNFGSVFQATALNQYLNQCGYDCEILDYRPAYYEKGNNAVKVIAGKILNFRSYFSRRKKFEAFIHKNEVLSQKRYQSVKQLQNTDCEGDVFVAGGDQLWNDYHPSGRDPAYKLTFVEKGYKLAIGTSMGRNNYTAEELKKLASIVGDFQFIGLRELSTVHMLNPFMPIEVRHTVDPVFLFEKEWYVKHYICKQRPINKKYAVVYLTPKTEMLEKTVKQLQKQGYQIVHICGFIKKCECDYMLKDAGPEEILSYIYHADFVLSASFHASLFSVMFHKQFATLLPRAQTNARIEDLMKFTELDKRILRTENDLDRLFDRLDFQNADKAMADLSRRTKNYITEQFEQL